LIRTETNVDACRQLWDAFSPMQDPWDDWDLMFAYHDADKHRFEFLVHHNDDGVADGLIPRVFDTKNQRHNLMGGSYPDGRVLWIDNAHFPEFFDQFADRTVFYDLKESWVTELLEAHPQYQAHFSERDFRYFLKPADFDYDFNNHINRFEADKRRDFNYDLRYIRKRNPVLTWTDDQRVELFIELVNRNFGDESDYVDPDNQRELHRIIDELDRSQRLKTLVIEIDGVPQAVSMSAVDSNKMIALYASSNNEYRNLGKLLNVETIQQACRMKLDEISYMTGMKWKADWEMSSEGCVTFRKPAAPWPELTA
jgi:hypothetical protein